MVGHLRSNPNVLDPFIRGIRFEATESLDKGRPLRRPILDDHVEATSEAYPRSGMCFVCCFSVKVILYMLFVSYGLILFTYILAGILAVRSAENKLRKCKFYAITRRGSIHRQRQKPVLVNKVQENK